MYMTTEEKETYLIMRGWQSSIHLKKGGWYAASMASHIRLDKFPFMFLTHEFRNLLQYGHKYYGRLALNADEAYELEQEFGNIYDK
jgi:hypothetical protein